MSNKGILDPAGSRADPSVRKMNSRMSCVRLWRRPSAKPCCAWARRPSLPARRSAPRNRIRQLDSGVDWDASRRPLSSRAATGQRAPLASKRLHLPSTRSCRSRIGRRCIRRGGPARRAGRRAARYRRRGMRRNAPTGRVKSRTGRHRERTYSAFRSHIMSRRKINTRRFSMPNITD